MYVYMQYTVCKEMSIYNDKEMEGGVYNVLH